MHQNRRGVIQIIVRWFLCLIIIGALAETRLTSVRSQAPDGMEAASRPIYLPMISKASGGMPVMLGVYPQGWPASPDVMKNEFHGLDTWAGKQHSIGGTFSGFEINDPDGNVTILLRTMWDHGYTPFVNIATDYSASGVANGQIDAYIRAWARAFKNYANNGQRMAFLAPLQEMNGDWVPYGLSPANYKLAYDRIQRIFREEGVPDNSVRWTFAPNGWSDPKDPPFESYYPGDSKVDVVGFSAYNFGYTIKGGIWQDPEDVFPKYMRRMYTMAPTKPIFIAQTATTAYSAPGNYNVNEKNRWLREAYPYLLTFNNLRAIIYFNVGSDPKLDWPFFVYDNPSKQFQGYRDGVADPRFVYIAPGDLINTDLSIK